MGKRVGILVVAVLLVIFAVVISSGGQTKINEQEALAVSKNGVDGTYVKTEGTEVIYLAGGCFWGMEKLTQALPGVLGAVSGYANGTGAVTPTYQLVCSGGTGFKETVRVEYDPAIISLAQLLQAYFLVIDPAVFNKQGNDIGTQYQTGVYYSDDASAKTVERYFEAEMKKHAAFCVEHEPLTSFFDAEEYHQDYLEKNPGGYCHIPRIEIEEVVALIEAENSYKKPTEEELKRLLSSEQYAVTQNAATERAFTGEYWDSHEVGIYVDITTGQPLFRSSDKYDSGCGWPSFTAPIGGGAVQYKVDASLGMERIEVKSKVGEAHLGHVFEGDPESPTGTRYCMNSASLRFVPKAEMEAQGYEAYLILFDEG